MSARHSPDADRDKAAAVLHAAVGEGRLTWAEHEERLAGVYAARTEAELTPWFADLPARPTASAVPAVAEPPLRVLLGKVRRRPDPALRSVQAEATLGAVVLDLRDLPAGAVLDVVANSLLGKVEVYVSPGTRLADTGTANLSKRTTVDHSRRRGSRPIPRPDAPFVRLSGHRAATSASPSAERYSPTARRASTSSPGAPSTRRTGMPQSCW